MLQQYVEIFYPGSFVSESSVRPVNDRRALAELPKGAYGYRFFAREEVKQGDEVLAGSRKDHSAYTFFGEVLTADDIAKLPGDHTILLSNMRCNGWPRVVRTVRGNFQPLSEGDVCVTT